MNAATEGDKAAAASDWPSAIKHYTNALIELPRAPSYYIKRSIAYSRRKASDATTSGGGPDFQAALRDVELALALARERGKRELIIEAQLRRAVVFFQLERYGDAGHIFDLLEGKLGIKNKDQDGDRSAQVQAAMSAQKASQKQENELSIWKLKIKGKISKLEAGDEKLVVSVKEYPDIKVPSEEELRKSLRNQLSSSSETSIADRTTESKLDVSSTTSTAPFTAGPGAPSAPAPAPAPVKIRHEWYQSQDSVVLTVYAKNVDKSKLDADLQENSLSLDFPLPSGSTFSFNLDPLYAPIDIAQSKVNVLSTKIEITLRKRTPGQKWSALEGSATAPVLSDPAAAAIEKPTSPSTSTSIPTQAGDAGPAYPTSSKHGVKNWDKLADDLTAKKKKEKKTSTEAETNTENNKEEQDDNDDDAASIDSDFGGGDAVDSFFKKLYANADPDTRRAMVKSYYESQGTSLSTNWDEVGKNKVPVHPPSSD